MRVTTEGPLDLFKLERGIMDLRTQILLSALSDAPDAEVQERLMNALDLLSMAATQIRRLRDVLSDLERVAARLNGSAKAQETMRKRRSTAAAGPLCHGCGKPDPTPTGSGYCATCEAKGQDYPAKQWGDYGEGHRERAGMVPRPVLRGDHRHGGAAVKALRAQFDSPYEQHADKIGKAFRIVGAKDPQSYDYDECGPMFLIRFDDGTEIEAWPEEVFDGMVCKERHDEP